MTSGFAASFILFLYMNLQKNNELALAPELQKKEIATYNKELNKSETPLVTPEEYVKQLTDNGLIVIDTLNELYPDRIKNYQGLSLKPLSENSQTFGIDDEYTKSLILEDLRFRSLLQKWNVDKRLKEDEQRLIASSLYSYFSDLATQKVWCIDDACLVLVSSGSKIDLCQYSKNNVFMGYSYCESRRASRNVGDRIEFITTAIYHNSIEDQLNDYF
jgi:hypothetical protein